MKTIEKDQLLDEKCLPFYTDKSFETYMREIRKISFIESPKELHSLITKAQQKDIKARNKVIESFLPLVVHVAWKNIFQTYLPLKELVAEGNFGLFLAVDTFKFNKGKAFKSFAFTLIEQTITAAIPLLEREITIPRHTSRDILDYDRADFILKSTLPHEPTREEVEDFVKFGRIRGENARLFRRPPVSIFANEDRDDIPCVAETLADSRSDPLSLLEQFEELLFIDKMLRKALRLCRTKKERAIICERFGIYEIEQGNETFLHFSLDKLTIKTLAEIGEEHGMTRMGILKREQKFHEAIQRMSTLERNKRERTRVRS